MLKRIIHWLDNCACGLEFEYNQTLSAEDVKHIAVGHKNVCDRHLPLVKGDDFSLAFVVALGEHKTKNSIRNAFAALLPDEDEPTITYGEYTIDVQHPLLSDNKNGLLAEIAASLPLYWTSSVIEDANGILLANPYIDANSNYNIQFGNELVKNDIIALL